MKALIPLAMSTIAGLSTLLGTLFIFLKVKEENQNKLITFFLSFSLAIMIGISITDLIPTSLNDLKQIPYGLFLSFFSFLIGIITIKMLITLLNKKKRNENSLYKLGILNMIALTLHNFPEGIATFLSTYQDFHLGVKLSLAIILHNIPEGIGIAVPIYYATKSKGKAIKAALFSGLSEPLGAIIAFLFLKNFISNSLISVVLLLVSAIMITISIEEIYPEAEKYKERKWLKYGLIMGVVLILINHFFL